ncbi:hypothetical protein [Comamonas sp. CMM02]|uniref:hypothetical protein n=1 Tax=Comamonas sp. CMM02 TaxID=2769307 RepID=UPI0017829483|nr:hypothetical protein [Comamonas sp. CMM02]MBD9401010.1 hypothetical protein [Comamonas sp. CMM02]
MFIESLTPDQLVEFAQLVIYAAFLGGVVGSMAGPILLGLFGLVTTGLEKVTRSPEARSRELHTKRRVLLTAAMTARRELRKLRHG